MEMKYAVMDKWGAVIAHDMSQYSAMIAANHLNSMDPSRGWTVMLESFE